MSRYAFCGNRFFALEAMLAAGLDVPHIAAVSGSYLEKTLTEKKISFTAVGNKKEFLDWLGAIKFDRFIANGCPYIVPISQFSGKIFINMHPSYLPDLRGADPIPGALLFARDAGATCHLMDAGVDTGDIIAQIKIPYSRELDALRLYPLCFAAEAGVMKSAIARDFKPIGPQRETGDEVYYSFKENDLMIDFSESAEAIIRRVRAFNTPNKLARFMLGGKMVKVCAAQIISADTPAQAGQMLMKAKDGWVMLTVA